MGIDGNNSSGLVVVQQEMRTPDFGIYICRYPVPAAPPVLPTVTLPGSPDPSEPFALALQTMYLPFPPRSKRYEYVPDGSVDGANGLWVQLPSSPLSVPLLVAREMRIEAELKVGILATPELIGVPFPAPILERVAWKVLTSVDVKAMVALCTWLSLEAECRGLEPLWLEDMVNLMQPQPPVRNRLLAEVRSGRPLYDHRVVRWVLRELAAASEEEIDRWRALEFPVGSGEDLLVRAWFRRVGANIPASPADVLTAMWMLHDVYDGSQGSSDVNAILARYSFGARASGTWLSAISRWLRIWDIPDDHPCVVGRANPSAMKDQFRRLMGVSPSQLLAGIFLYCIRWQLAIGEQVPPPTSWDQVMNLQFGEEVLHLDPEFEAILRSEFVATIDEIGTQANAERQDEMADIGQLPTGDSLACRNNPIIEFSDGQVLPHSIELTVDRAIDLYRLKGHGKGSGRAGNREVGYLFEAYVHDLLQQLQEKYLVIGSTELEDIAREHGGKVCDHVVVDASDGSYVFIETSLQTNPRGIALGDMSAIQKKVRQYQAEADQAFEMMEDAGKLAKCIEGPEPRFATALVVVDRPILHASSLVKDLMPRIDGRPSRIICGIDEFELLIDMTRVGWGFHSLVIGWQQGSEDVTLGDYLFERSRIVPPASPSVSLDAEALLECVPLRQSHAA